MNTYLRKTLKIILWVFASIIFLVIALALSLNIPSVQNFAKNKAIQYIKKKTNTEVSLKSIRIAFPRDVVLDEFYLEDLKGDTLLYAERLAVDVNLFKLMKSQIEVNNIELKNIKANVTRIAPDTTFNFNFLVKAFMSDQKKPQDQIDKDTTSTLKFSVDKFSFNQIDIRYKDDVAGNDLRVKFDDFNARIKDFDLNAQIYKVGDIQLKNAQLQYFQQKPLAFLANHLENSVDPKKAPNAKLPNIEIESLNFQNVNVNFNDQLSETQALASLNTLLLKNAVIDLTNMKYNIGHTELNNSRIKFAFKPQTKDTNKADVDTANASPIQLALKKIVLKNNTLTFDNLSAPKAKKGIDFNHLLVSDLNFQAKDFSYINNGIAVAVEQASLKEKSGFQLDQLSGTANYNDQAIVLKDFVLNTPNTKINSQAQVTFQQLEDLSKKPENVKIDLKILNTELGLKDASFFSDAIPPQYANLKLQLNSTINGTLDNLNIQNFQASGLSNTNIDISGKVTQVTNIEKAFLDLKIKRFVTSKKDLNLVLPKGTLPNTLNLPNTVAMSGFFKGSTTKFNTELALKSSIGNANIVANLSPGERYKAKVDLLNFNAGSLLNQQQKMGSITLTANAEGQGFDPKTGTAKVNAVVKSAQYNNYTYQNIQLNANLANQKLEVSGVSNDQNVDFELSANGNLGGKYPQILANLHLKQIDLQKLNFSPTEFKIAGKIKADFQSADLNYLNGSLNATMLQIVKEGKRINIDTIQVLASADANSNSLILKSEVLQAELKGKFEIANIGQAFINQLNKYYKFGTVKSIPNQNVAFNLNVYNSNLLKDFVPQLTTFSGGRINGTLNTEADSLSLRAWFPKIVYGQNTVDSTLLTLGNTDQKLDYALNINSIQTPSIQLFKAEVSGNAADNNLNLNIFLRDRARKDRYTLSGVFNQAAGNFKFSLNPENLLLNYEKWTVNPDNFIQYGPSGILANNFNLSQGNQLLRVNNVAVGAPLNVELKNFNIETLTSFAETDSALVGGIINGTATLRDIQSNLKFDANLTVDALRFQKDALGTLRLDANNSTADAIELNAALSGIHDLRVNGFYYTKDKGALDLKIQLNKLNLAFIESLSGGQISNGKGEISALLTATGPISSPKILGKLNFNDAGFNVKYVNSYFRIPNEQIDFTNQGVKFNSFTMIDSLDQTARIDGMIFTDNYRDFKFDLGLRTDNFRALHSTEKDNELIYGTVFLSTNLKVTGNLDQPVVNGNVNINKDTKFFFALPSDDPSVIEQSGIVQFIDADAPPFNGERALNVDSLSRSSITGMNLSVNIEIDKEAELNIVIDPSNGDALRVKGEGSLNATMDPSGKTSLTGRYQLSDGSYNLSVGGLTRKEFRIQPDSYIVWTGEPTSANINITALYEVNTAAIDLVADQVETMDASVRNTYKQKLPFQVYLYLSGELLKPDVKFKIDLPEDERAGTVGVAAFAKLQQVNANESELNKQVFALLALNRFISENPFESLSGGSSTSSIARQSVSKLLTEQLNNLASDLIKGIDINLGVNSVEDYSSGNLQNRTDLEVGLSKRLLNDRLTISVGSTFGVEGSRPSNQKSSNIAGNINVEYLLSADGRYRLRFYRRNETEGIVEGQIIETGVGFALVVEYNRFREIFRKASKRRDNTERRNNAAKNTEEQP